MRHQPRIRHLLHRALAPAALLGALLGNGCTSSDKNTTPTTPTTPTTSAVGGTVAGLTGSGLVLQNNGGNNLSVSAGATTFTFSTSVPRGGAYAVTVDTQPSAQACTVSNGSGTASANVTSVVVNCQASSAGGTGSFSTNGGTVTTPAAIVTAPAGATVTSQTLTVATITPPAGLPSGFSAVGVAVDISVSSPATVNMPFLITLPYSTTGITNENDMAVVHYDATRQRYEPVTILKHDLTAHTFQIEARTFSPFLVVTFSSLALPASHTVTGFSPATNGWNIPNFGSYFTPGGNCLGMSAYGVWYFENSQSPSLSTKYSSAGFPSIAQLVAIRAHLAQSQYWALQSNTYLSQLGPAATGALMKMYLDLTDQPLILLLGTNGSPAHASILYGYNASGFLFDDVNVVGATQSLTFNGSAFGTYGAYNSFTFVALPSLGRTEDFAALTTEATGGFTSSSEITVTSPTPNQQINAHSVALTGSLSAPLNSASTLIAYIKGIQQNVQNNGGTFSATLPIANGDNPIVMIAGVNIAQQSNWYQNSATKIMSVTGTAAPAKLFVTLTWSQNGTDVDLYVTEPAPSNQTAWYASTQTSNRLSLDFDNTTGFGPEHTSLATTGTNPGAALSGLYKIGVHYYSDHGSGLPATGTVSIVVNEGLVNQVLTTKNFSIATSNSGNSTPGSSGPDWVSIANVDLINGTISAPASGDLLVGPPIKQTAPAKDKWGKPPF